MGVNFANIQLASNEKSTGNIVINTWEDFIWRLLDVVSRTNDAISRLSRVEEEMPWDNGEDGSPTKELIHSYQPPQSDSLFSIKELRIQPLSVQVSFNRSPQKDRYKHLEGVSQDKLMNYLTGQLKFTIDQLQLRFPRYIRQNIRGTSDHITEIITNHYVGKIKSKWIHIISAMSIGEWKNLTGREDGDDEFVDGDILRGTGNMLGKGTGFVVNKGTTLIGQGMSGVTNKVGNQVEQMTDVVGLGRVGGAVNSVVSGVGDGVSNAVMGVGAGASSVLKGAGKGSGQVIGGLTGGIVPVAKGLGTGIVTGDGR